MGPLVRLISGLVASASNSTNPPAEQQTQPEGRRQRTYTPSASEVDGPTISTSAAQSRQVTGRTEPAGLPPSYVESLDGRTDRRLAAGSAPNGDHKIQTHDEFDNDSDVSDESDLTLSDLVDEDEAAWALDDIAAEDEPPSYEDATNVPSEEDMIREIIADQQSHTRSAQTTRLPCPVILPQRRPDTRSRGFVRAYAPVLQNVGIDQTTFSKFLYNLHKSSQANPWFSLIMVSASALSSSPAAVALAVETSMQCTRATQTGRKTNTFLDRMNEELFKPAGCFAFVMRYKAEAEAPDESSGFFGIGVANVDVSVNQIVPKYDRDNSEGVANLTTALKLFRLGTPGARSPDVATSAPLIFPEIDRSIYGGSKGAENLKGKAPDALQIVQDYIERRSQMYLGDEKQPLADDGHPLDRNITGGSGRNAGNVGVAGLLSNAALELQDRAEQRRGQRQDRRHARHERHAERREQRHERKMNRFERRIERNVHRFEKRLGRTPRGISWTKENDQLDAEPVPGQRSVEPLEHDSRISRQRYGHRVRSRQDGASRALNGEVLYLVIVNLPSDQELANARAMLEGE